ncbi:MAG: peptidylprolyl isomerase [Clostridia bacterium]|nr:peptidylprolyl isomerase [Clostridia bacterium]
MRHTIVKLTGLLVVLALTLTGCNLIGIDPMMQLDEDFAKLDKDYAAVVAEYDGGTVTKGDALGRFASMYSYYAQMYSMFGMSMTNDVVNSVKEQAAEAVVEAAAVAKELEKRGLSLSEDKLAEVQKTADENYKSAYDNFYEKAAGKGDVKARQTEYDMYANGYSKDTFYNTQLDEANHELLQETVKAEIPDLTEEDMQAAYDDKVNEDKQAYADSASAFESAMSSDSEIVAWIPEGYRTVKHILVKPEDDVLTAVTDARAELSTAKNELNTFENELSELNEKDAADDAEAEDAEAEDAEAEDAEAEPAEAARTAEDIQADIDRTKADIEAKQKAVEEAEAACLASVKDKTDEIYAKIEAGEDFAGLIEEYGEDPGMKNEPTASRGYYVCAAKGNWDENFNDGAMSLEKVGDVTMTPVVSSSGVHIIRYESDVTGGPVPLEDIREKLHDTTLQDRKDDHYDDVLSGIVEALNPVYHMEAFNIA